MQSLQDLIGVGMLERDVAESFRPGQRAGALDRERRHIEPQRTTRLGGTRGFSGRLSCAATYVDDSIVKLDVDETAQYLVMPL